MKTNFTFIRGGGLFGFLMCLWLSANPALAEVRNSDLWWLPHNVSVGGRDIDHIFYFIFYLTAVVFVLTQALLVYFLFKYRQKKGVKAIYSHGNNTFEIIWTTLPIIIFIGLAIYSDRLWFQLRATPAPANSLNIEIVAEQFGWNLHYPGPDGKLGHTDPKFVSPTNKLGIDPNDPDGKDDFVTYNDFHIPSGRPVHLILRSRDVIHAFYVPEFRLYQDLVPGRTITWIWFDTTKTGHFAIACNQLCGSGHYNMQAATELVSADDFEKWVDSKSKPATATASMLNSNPQVASAKP